MTATKLLALVLGFWLLMRSVNKDASGRTLIDHILGNQQSKSPYLDAALPAAGGASGATVPSSWNGRNPFPGATGSRLDQGFDLTAKDFLAPFTGKIVYAAQTDPGWAGGGYIAIQNQSNPSQVMYLAEGIAPVVQTGQTVTAGQRIAIPRSNPYNMIVGNVEAGWANPSNPRQPLAQASSNRPSVAFSFYNWLRKLGGPAATSTSSAGYP